MSPDEQIALLQKNFDDVARQDGVSGIEFWYARDLQPLLGYARWENFSVALERAKTACKNACGRIEDHFRDVTKMVDLGSGAKREIADVMLTRYACYLIAQNGDPRKEQIAFAQSYFAVQTRRQELIRDRMNLLARLDARERLKEAKEEGFCKMEVKQHAFTKAKRRSRRFRGNVLRQDVRERNFALTGLVDFVSRVVGFRFASPYANQLRALGAWFARREVSLFSLGGIAQECEFVGTYNIGSNWIYFCPNGAKLVSIGQAQRSPMDLGKKVGTLKECDCREDA